MTMIKLLLVELLLLLFPISALRVYLLAGDTNMEGYANITHLANLMTVSGSRFSRYGSNQGFNVRNDVFIRTQRNEIGALSIGYGARSNTFGPELGFGFEVGDYFEDDVLIIKAAWDNSSLNQDFRPPSSSGGTGPRYEDMINMYRSTIEDLATFAPLYGGGGYSLEGFVWFHGYQDSLSEGAINEYEGLLINLLRDLIRDLGEPNLPIIIGELGMQGSNPSTSHVRMRAIQRLVAERREFNAIFVSTSPFVNTSETFDAVSRYYGRADTIVRIGEAFADAAIQLFEPSPTRAPTPLPTPAPTPTRGRCDDDKENRFQVAPGQTEPCVWLATRPLEIPKFCQPGSEAWNLCEETCGKCVDSCEDTKAKFEVDGIGRDCSWLFLRVGVQKQICTPGNDAYLACPETCDVPSCDGLLPGSTPSPTPKPTQKPTPRPTLSTQTSCAVVASIQCRLQNGKPCSSLLAIPSSSFLCDINENALEMGWFYRSGSCLDTDTTQQFFCEDRQGGPPSTNRAFLRARGLSSREVYFRDTVAPGDFVQMRKSSNNDSLEEFVEVTVFNSTESGVVLQSMIINLRCSGSEDLTIGKTFGSLEFASYTPINGFKVSGYEMVAYEIFVRNSGQVDFDLLSLTIEIDDVLQGYRASKSVLTVGEALSDQIPYYVSLISSQTFSSSISVRGRSLISGNECASEDTDSFLVRPYRSNEPTPAPAPSFVCDDDQDAIFYVPEQSSFQSCAWLPINSNFRGTYCAATHPSGVREICRETCGACTDNCKDTNTSFQINNVSRDCTWLSLRPFIQETECLPGMNGSVFCPETCNVCDEASTRPPNNPPSPTRPPTRLPTRPPTNPPTPFTKEKCDDEKLQTFFVQETNKNERCVWLESRSDFRKIYCQPNHPSGAYALCEETCGKCSDTCEDDSNAKFEIDVNGRIRTCLWLRLRPEQLATACLPGMSAYTFCGETCDVCD